MLHHHNNLLQYIPPTPSAEPSNHIIPSPHELSILQCIYITPSADPIDQIITSPHQHSLITTNAPSPLQKIQDIRLSCHPISRVYFSLFFVTTSEEPRNKIITSPHKKRQLQFIYRDPIKRDNKPGYPVTPSAETITVYFLSPH